MPDDTYARLLQDDLDPPADLPAWESYGDWHLMITAKGVAVVFLPVGRQGSGIAPGTGAIRGPNPARNVA